MKEGEGTSSAGSPLGEPDNGLSARAQGHMLTLTPHSREALLLNVIEGFTVATIRGTTAPVSAVNMGTGKYFFIKPF